MTGDVGEKIFIHDPDENLLKWCEEHLVINNPDYIKKKAMGLWTGNVPKKFYLYEQAGGGILLPFGCLHAVHEQFPEIALRSCIKRSDGFCYGSRINLYPYQQNAVEAILERMNGILVMPCGSGKTQTALEVVSRIGMRALWLTHTQDLLTQSMNRARSVFDAESATYGTITAGKVNVGSGLTFATVQTASKIDLSRYKNEFGAVIVDECHRAVGTPTKAMQFYRVLSALSCRYKIGLTATPKRSDGMSRTMFSLLGDVAYEVSREDVANTTCPVSVRQIETGYTPDMDMALCGDGTINFAGLIDDLTHNDKRFWTVLHMVEKLPAHEPVLVLANRVEYLKRMNREYFGASQCLSGMGNSKAAREERKRALKALNGGEIDCLFATYQLAKEGLDVPNLRHVVFATPEKDEATVIQAAGRVARKHEGKEKGTVIDFIDDFGMLHGWAKKRESIYVKKLGFNIDICEAM